MTEELIYRQERFVFQGEVYWQRVCPPWKLVTVLTAVNISLSGVLAQRNDSPDPYGDVLLPHTKETVLQINAGDESVIVPATLVRESRDRQLAFVFQEHSSELELLISQIKTGN